MLEFVGAHRLKMGEISEKWLSEIRSLANEKALQDIEANKLGEVLDYDAQIFSFERLVLYSKRLPTLF